MNRNENEMRTKRRHTELDKEMRITSSHRFFGLPGSLTLWVILPKNLHKRNDFVSLDDLEWIQVLQTRTYQAESDQKDKMRHAMDDNGIPSKEIHERTIRESCDKLVGKPPDDTKATPIRSNLKRTMKSRTDLPLIPKR
ncbi:hypothetical protein Tco_0947791 [Tanacetum coccineum]